MKKAIIAFGVGYRYEDIRYFIQSCNRYAPGADVIVYVGKNIAELKQQCAHFSHLTLIRYQEPLAPKLIAKVLTRIPVLARLYARAIRTLWQWHLMPDFMAYACAIPLLQFMVKRFFVIEQLMKSMDHQQFMLTDLRDVLLQDDPFNGISPTTIVTGIEPLSIEQSEMNASWVRRTLSASYLETISDKPIVCAGVTVGGRKAIEQYCREMNEEVLLNLPKLIHMLGPDQAIHIRLFYSRLKGMDKHFESNGSGSIATLHYSNLSEFFIDNGTIRNCAGKKLAVVHQYDRHPDLAAELRA
ncbi:MAG: hypothetical protein K1X47_11655, partial [Cyclobacteriaceae bacterium]|nr:hypothetical protein [Cyclobacteriaceae bacterium]